MTNPRQSRESRVSRLAFAVALLVGAAKPALAQEAELDDVIVVTATRSATALDDIPARVEVISRQDIENRGYVTAVEVLGSTPGINVVQSGGAGTLTSVFSRGANSKHTLALFDGIRLNDASSPNGQYNFGQDTVAGLERIEVVRGAASSIYGSDAIGGVINFIPRVGGGDAFELFFETAIGSRDTYRLMLGANGDSGPIAYALSAEHFETSGFNNVPDRFPNNLNEDDGSSFNAFTGVADLRLSGNAVIRGLVRWRNTEADIDDAALDRLAHSIEDEYFVWRVGPRFMLLNDKLEIEINGGQVDNERADINGADVNQAFPVSSGAGGVRNFANWRNALTLGDFAGLSDVTIAAGLEWQNEEIETSGGYSAPLTRDEDNLGAYATVRATVVDRVDLSASLRRDDTDSYGEANTWNFGAVLDLPAINGRLYASYGTSFKAPTLSERFSSSLYTIPNPALVPEEGRSWEIGGDLRPLHGLTIGATYFNTEIDNLIEYVVNQNQNVGVAEIDGYEAYVELAPAESFKLRVNYTYTDARNGLTDARLLRRPPHAWGVTAEWTPIDPLLITLAYAHRGDRVDVLYGNTNPWGLGGGYLGNGIAEGYDLVSISGRFNVNESFSIFATANNLLDEDYEDPNSFRGAPQSFSIGVRGSF
jgi:vitamin B12 transporter